MQVLREIFGRLVKSARCAAEHAEIAKMPSAPRQIPTSLLLQRDLLRAPIPDLADEQIVLSGSRSR